MGQWLVGHVPGIEDCGHCGSNPPLGICAFGHRTAHHPFLFHTHTRPHLTTTNTRDTPCPSSTLGKIFEMRHGSMVSRPRPWNRRFWTLRFEPSFGHLCVWAPHSTPSTPFSHTRAHT